MHVVFSRNNELFNFNLGYIISYILSHEHYLASMQAIIQDQHGGPETLTVGNAEKPAPKANEICIRVKATALNRADLLQRRGLYPPPDGASELLGLEVAGEVSAVGSDTSPWKVGDRVCALLPGGGYAQYACVDSGLAMPVPESMPFAEAVAVPEAFITAWQALVWLAKIKEDETVLIHAGASGVGLAAIQIAKQKGCRVFATASSAKLDICRQVGTTDAFDYKAGDFLIPLMKATDDQGVDVVIDLVGAPYLGSNLQALKTDGRLILLGLLGGRKHQEELDLGMVLRKRIKIQGSTLRSRSLTYKQDLVSDFWHFAQERFADGRLDPVIHAIYHWSQVQQAHALMERNGNVGKIVMLVD